MIGNIVAGTLSAGAPPVAPSSYESISTVTVGSGGVSSVSFTSIPSDYKHLQIRYALRSGTNNTNTVLTFNTDTGSNYSTHFLVGDGSSVSAGALANSTFIYTDIASQSSTSYVGAVVDVLDYGSTSKYKTVKTLAGIDKNGSGVIWLASGSWRSTSAITSLRLIFSDSTTITEYSHFALYGIKD
jgi:hypothetical protein